VILTRLAAFEGGRATVATRQSPAEQPEAPHRRRFPIVTVALAIIAAVLLLVLIVGYLFVRELTRDEPRFASLAASPDASLQGTVAYLADANGCVRIVAAAGQSSKEVLCLPRMDVSEAQKLGKEVGPQLVWRPDGRLEVTMFRMTDPPGPDFRAGWQKLVDVRTGAVEDVPASEVPSEPNLGTHPTVSPTGERVSMSSDAESGRIKIVLTDADGVSRTLLSAHGPPNYTYGLNTAFWAPHFDWIAADDGRILIVTTATPSVTRVLTDESRNAVFGGDDPRLARFAVTAENILTP
jgi:hypothetical protein